MAPEKRGMFEVYKKGQGVRSRVVSIITLLLFIGFGCYSLMRTLRGRMESVVAVGDLSVPLWGLIPGAICLALLLLTLYILNRPRVVDFLINTEGELRKVAWPSRDDAVRQAIVVIVVVMIFAALIFVFDIVFSKMVMTHILPG